MKKKILIIVCIAAITIFLAGEIIGRYKGLANLPLFRVDKNYEYIAKPNQNLKIYGNKFRTNSMSMRSDELTGDDSCIVLLIGDSIIYGGNSIDQDSLVSVLLQKMLSQKFKKRVTVLNISAQSWGPGNGAEYIKRHGLFGAKAIVLVYSSHDANDNIDFKTPVGEPPLYTKNPVLAWQTIFDKAWPRVKAKFTNPEAGHPRADTLPIFNSGFSFFASVAKANNIPLSLYLHSEVSELRKGSYSGKGQEIINFCDQNNIPVIKGMENETEDLYEDDIHFNARGQKMMAKKIFDAGVKNL